MTDSPSKLVFTPNGWNRKRSIFEKPRRRSYSNKYHKDLLETRRNL